MVGTEGLWGLAIYSIALPILSVVKCPFGSACIEYPRDSTPHFENPTLYI